MNSAGISGQFFQASSSKSTAGTVFVRGGEVQFESTDGQTTLVLEVASIQDGHIVLFRAGSSFVADHPLPPEFLQAHQSRAKRLVSWLEKLTWYKGLALLAALFLFLIGFRVGLSSASHIIAAMVPSTWEQQFGESVYQTVSPIFFSESQLPQSVQASILSDAGQITNAIKDGEHIDILFHQSDEFGANALALPGGPIIITDDLVHLLSREQILAVLAHEYAHIMQRHHLENIAELIGVSLLGYLVFGVDETVSEELVALALYIWGFSQSRESEREADLVAVEYLRDAGIDPIHLIEALDTLTDSQCTASEDGRTVDDCGPQIPDWLSTHPSGAERQAYLRAAISELN